MKHLRKSGSVARIPGTLVSSLCMTSDPQIKPRIKKDIGKGDREKCRMLWVAVPGHHEINNLQLALNRRT